MFKMGMSLTRRILKELLPPVVPKAVRLLKHRFSTDSAAIKWNGNYSNWQEAAQASTGYAQEAILERVKEASLKVRTGQAVYERDGVVFDAVQYSWPLLVGLQLAAIRSNGNLRVLDFGGSLGTTYFQNRKFLDLIPNVVWIVVEQSNYVQVGRDMFADNTLQFDDNLVKVLSDSEPNTVVLSGVLQYLESPYSIIKTIAGKSVRTVIVDRTPFSTSGRERITVQTVPESIYRASYPCRFLVWSELETVLGALGFNLLEKFPSFCDQNGSGVEWRGGIWIRPEL